MSTPVRSILVLAFPNAQLLDVTRPLAVEQFRIEAAQRLFGDTYGSVKRIASRCGFGAEGTIRRRFVRVLGVTPQAYRERFAP